MKLSKKLALSLTVLAVTVSVGMSPTYAKDNFFGGVKTNNTQVSTPPQNLPFDEVLPPAGVNDVTNNNTGLTSQNLQDALINLDSAQVEIRKNLSVTQQKFSEVDKNFVMVKTERKLLKKQIKETQKRLGTLEKAKQKIKKEMNVVNN